MAHPLCVVQLQIYIYIYILPKTFIHSVQSRIKQPTCFGLLSHHQAFIMNIKTTLNTAMGTRSLPLHMIIHYKSIYNLKKTF